MKQGDRIRIKTPFYEGWARIELFVDCYFYPIFVSLEGEGDYTGHMYCRVNEAEIIEKEGDSNETNLRL